MTVYNKFHVISYIMFHNNKVTEKKITCVSEYETNDSVNNYSSTHADNYL